MRRVALAATLVILAAGCSSDGAAELDLGTVASSPSTTVVLATTTTTTVPSTEPPVVSPAPTTVAATTPTDPPTTEPPTTAPISKEDQVRAAFLAARGLRQDCSYDPESCNFEAIAVPGSPMDVATRRSVATSIADNVRGKRGFGDVMVKVESVGLEGEAAFVTACAFDTGVLFDLADPANPDDDNIVDDSVASYRVRWEMHLVEGMWLIFDNEEIERLTGSDLCEF